MLQFIAVESLSGSVTLSSPFPFDDLVRKARDSAGDVWERVVVRGRCWGSAFREVMLDARYGREHTKGRNRERCYSLPENVQLGEYDDNATEFIEGLSPMHKSIALRLLEGYTQTEIARQDNVSKMTVSVRVAAMCREARELLA